MSINNIQQRRHHRRALSDRRQLLRRRRVANVAAVSPSVITVCTEGDWSICTAFSACDDFRITIDGPGAEDVKINASVEFFEEVVV